MSRPVPKAGWRNLVTFGELRIVTGRETVQTQLEMVSDCCLSLLLSFHLLPCLLGDKGIKA